MSSTPKHPAVNPSAASDAYSDLLWLKTRGVDVRIRIVGNGWVVERQMGHDYVVADSLEAATRKALAKWCEDLVDE